MANPQTFGRAKYLNANTNQHTAWDIRPSEYGIPPGPGVAGYEDYRVIQRQAGANMSVDVGTTAQTALGMTAWTRGSSRGRQGLYENTSVDWTAPTTNTYIAQLNVDVSNNASGNPRLDQVVLEVLDLQHAGSGSSVQQIRVVAGVATAGATLDNRNGAAALPASSQLLADILVPNGAASIGTADIRDRRTCPLPGTLAWGSAIGAVLNIVAFIPAPGLLIGQASWSHASNDLDMSSALMFLPRRIQNAVSIRWEYVQGATALTGNYAIGIYDMSGRQIVTTGAVAYAGALGTLQSRSETITSTTFEAGNYIVVFANDSAAAGSAGSIAVNYGAAANSVACFPGTGGITDGAGSTTLPNPLTASAGANTQIGNASFLPVPLIALAS